MSIMSPKVLEHRRILVVDDQKFIRGLVAQGLKGVGAEVVEAGDGFEALTILGLQDDLSGSTIDSLRRQRPDMFDTGRTVRSKFDAVITDIRMGPMNGLEMLKALRAGMCKASRDLPVVIMSAHSDDALIGAAIALDANGFIAKPVSQKAIVERLLRSLKMHLPLKEPEVYRMLIIPELDEVTLETDVVNLAESVVAVIRAGDVAAASGLRTLTVAWEALALGDVLADNLTTKAGRLVAPAGTRVTEVLVAALGDLSHLTELAPTVSVRRKV